MDPATEAQALQWLERALELPTDARLAWLEQQELAASLADRVRTLLGRFEASRTFLDAPAEAPRQLLPRVGERLGAWRLLRELGSGGMGVVFVAERADGNFDQQAAIKLVRVADPQRQPELLRRFENERQLLARLEHPNVVRILDGGTTEDGVPWLAMEYVDGEPITAWCDRRRLGVRQRVRLLAETCAGVQAAHQHLIVHRDLKPGNILIDDDGRPRVLDFGIARLLDEEEDHTQTQLHALTPAYASPEQVRRQPLTTASDVYSLGVLLHELVSGRRPHDFTGLSPGQIENILTDGEPPSLRQSLLDADLEVAERRRQLGDIGTDLERICAKALHRDASRRYGSAQALAEDLQRYLEGRPVQAHPDSRGYRLRRFVGRNRVGVAVATVAGIAVLAAAGIAVWQGIEAREAAADTAMVNEFLVDLLTASNPYETGRELTLAEALDLGASEVDRRFGERPDLAVDIRLALGRSMLERAHLDAAEHQLSRALADSEEVFGPDDSRTVHVVLALASLRREQLRDPEAEAMYLDAIQRLERAGRVRGQLYSSALNNLAVFRLERQEFAAAEKLLRVSVQVGGNADDHSFNEEERGQTLANLAVAVGRQGNLDEAEEIYAEIESIFSRIYPDGSRQYAMLLNNRARLARDRKEPGRALVFLQRAVAMHRGVYSGDHASILVATTNLARQAIESQRLDLASEPAEAAVAMAERMYGEMPHFYLAHAHTTLADLRLWQRRPDEARESLARARDVLDQLGTEDRGSRQYLDRVQARLCAEYAADPACTSAP